VYGLPEEPLTAWLTRFVAPGKPKSLIAALQTFG
jgi:hypothetical protein